MIRRILRWCASFDRRAASQCARELGFGNYYQPAAFWQADHIRECARGGWGTGLDNLRTLCTPCHKEETARLAAELAEDRKNAKESTTSLFAPLVTPLR